MPPDDTAAIRLVLLDVDGVLTDGRLYYGDQGEERKVFHSQDGYALRVAGRLGLPVGLVSGRSLPAVARRGAELGLDPIMLGVGDKRPAVDQELERRGLDWSTVAFIGDDLPDLPCLLAAGLSIAPADANPLIRRRVDWVLDRPGGQGAVARALLHILHQRGHGIGPDLAALHG